MKSRCLFECVCVCVVKRNVKMLRNICDNMFDVVYDPLINICAERRITIQCLTTKKKGTKLKYF